jgi:hypothetical protein
MKVVPLRLQSGDDLRVALETLTVEQEEQAGCGGIGCLGLPGGSTTFLLIGNGDTIRVPDAPESD